MEEGERGRETMRGGEVAKREERGGERKEERNITCSWWR